MPEVRIDETLEMHYEDDDFTDPWKQAQTVVFQHTNFGSSKMYYRWAPVVARHYRLIRLNRRGTAQSTVPPSDYVWSLSGLAGDMLEFLDRLDLQKVHLIGDATGAYVSVRFAYEYPERLSSLTLINCSTTLMGQPGVSEFSKILEEEGVGNWVRKTMNIRFDPSQVDPDYIEWHAQEKIRQPQQATTALAKYLYTVDVSDILPDVKVPTLVIAGERTVIHSQENAERLQELIPNCKVATIPGVFGFSAHVAPERCAEVWLDFVRGLG